MRVGGRVDGGGHARRGAGRRAGVPAALLTRVAARVERAAGRPEPAGQLAALVDRAYTSAAHLGPDGSAAGLALAHVLVDEAQ